MLGHASAAMTLDRYADLFDDDLDQVAESLDRLRAASCGPAADFLRTGRLPGTLTGAISEGKRAGQEPMREWRRGESNP